MLGLTHYYARLLAKEGITVNAIAPALVETEMVTSNPNARLDTIPVGRLDCRGSCASRGHARSEWVYDWTDVNVNGGWFMSYGLSSKRLSQRASLPGWMPSPRTKVAPTAPTTADWCQAQTLADLIDAFDASAVGPHYVGHSETFELVGGPRELLVGRRKEMKTTEHGVYGSVRKFFFGKREDVDHAGVAATRNQDEALGCVDKQ
jgi:hypothetical protein